MVGALLTKFHHGLTTFTRVARPCILPGVFSNSTLDPTCISTMPAAFRRMWL